MSQKIKTPIILEVKDPAAGIKGWLALDTLINNRSCGGLRLCKDISAFEIADLAKAMTLKFGFLGLPHGGAKGGIIFEEEAPLEYKSFLLKSFLEKTESMLGDIIYEPYPDLGTNRQCVCDALRMLGKSMPKRAIVVEKGGWYTSLTVFAGAKAAAVYKGIDLSKSRVAVEGFGKVGSCVAENFYRLGSKVVAISTSKGALFSAQGLDIPKLISLSRNFGSNVIDNYKEAQRIERGKLLELDVDVLLPCAKGYTINMENVSRVKSKLISPGANCPASKEAQKFLFEKGTLYIPCFISNCGGVLGGTMEFAGFSPEAIAQSIESVFLKQVSGLIKESLDSGVNLVELAEKIAMERFGRIKSAAENKSFTKSAFKFGLGLYRNGIVPKFITRKLSREYFNKRLRGQI